MFDVRMNSWLLLIAALAATGAVAGCSSRTTGPGPLATPPAVPPPAHTLYVASSNLNGTSGANAIYLFPATATGGGLYATIAGSATHLLSPNGVTTDAAGNVWVTNTDSNSITEYPAGKVGNVAPVVTIAGPTTTLSSPVGIVFDGSGNIWVANNGVNNDVLEFAASANGNVAPVNTITSSVIQKPEYLAFDSSGLLWVSSYNQDSSGNWNVAAFKTTDGLNATPTRDIFDPGNCSSVCLPLGIAFDAAGDLIVAQFWNDVVAVYPPPVGGNESPSITNTNFSGSGPWGLAVDSAGDVFTDDPLQTNGHPTGQVKALAANALGGAPTLFSATLRNPTGVWVK